MYPSGEDDSLARILVAAHKWHVVDNIVDDTRDAGDVDSQHPNKPDTPVGPDPLELGVDDDSESGDGDEAEEHSKHGLEGGLVHDIVAGPGVDKIEHLVGGDVTIGVGDGPLVFLDVEFLLDFGDEGHFGLGYHQVGDRFESVLQSGHAYHIEHRLRVSVECHHHEEHRLLR